MRRFLLAAAAIAAIIVAVGVLMPYDLIDRCLDHGGRWNYNGGECECTPKQLADPAVKPEFIAYCNEPRPAPTD